MINAVSGAASSSSTDASQAIDANELIAEHTDPQRRVDTRGLAALVHQASTEDPGKASAAYADIENALAAQSSLDGSHFAEDTRAAFAAAATTGSAVGALKGGAVLGQAGTDAIARGARQTAPAVQTLKDNPILSKEWVGFESAWTGKGGFTGPLKSVLDAQGITYNATGNERQPPATLNGRTSSWGGRQITVDVQSSPGVREPGRASHRTSATGHPVPLPMPRTLRHKRSLSHAIATLSATARDAPPVPRANRRSHQVPPAPGLP
jgi:hypothetical protein